NFNLTRQSNRLRLALGLSLMFLGILAAAGLMRPGQASSAASAVVPLSGDTCGTATVINPAALSFVENSTLAGAANDIDPGPGGFTSAQSPHGPVVVYQFTPADTQVYNIIVTPAAHYDVSLYLTTNCSTIAGCIGSDLGGIGDPETIIHNLIAG